MTRAPFGCSYAPVTVWNVARSLEGEGLGQDFEIGVSLGSKARLIGATQVILATGAQERPFPDQELDAAQGL